MGARRRPLAFTEQGVAMLSSVLGSKRAIQVNIAIMRAFVAFREMLATHISFTIIHFCLDYAGGIRRAKTTT